MHYSKKFIFVAMILSFFSATLFFLPRVHACNFYLINQFPSQFATKVAVTVSLDFAEVFEIKDAVEHLKRSYGFEAPVVPKDYFIIKGMIDPSQILKMSADKNVMFIDLASDFTWADAGQKSETYSQKIDEPLKDAFDKLAKLEEQKRYRESDRFFVMRFVFNLDAQNPELSLFSFRNLLKKLNTKPGVCKVQSFTEPTSNSPGVIVYQAGTGHAKDAILSLPGTAERSRAELMFMGDFPI